VLDPGKELGRERRFTLVVAREQANDDVRVKKSSRHLGLLILRRSFFCDAALKFRPEGTKILGMPRRPYRSVEHSHH
jgi:hypothetical protein